VPPDAVTLPLTVVGVVPPPAPEPVPVLPPEPVPVPVSTGQVVPPLALHPLGAAWHLLVVTSQYQPP
jgi:hypothetical protein